MRLNIDLPPRPQTHLKSRANQSSLVADCLDWSTEKFERLKQQNPDRIPWDKMKIQNYTNKKKIITDKKRRLYKKYLNLGVSGVDPTVKEVKESVSRKARPPEYLRK